MMNEKRLHFMIIIVTLVMAAYIVSGMLVQFVVGRMPIEKGAAAYEEHFKAGANKIFNLDYYAPVWERNIFNPERESAVEPEMFDVGVVEEEVEVEEEMDVPLSSLNYKLIGTVVGPPADSFAIIDTGDKKKQMLYRLGEKIGDVEIIRIQRNRVILNNAGREEMLEVKFDEVALAIRDARRTDAAGSRGIRKVSANKFILDREEVERLSGDVSRFMTQVRVVPNLVKGKPSGYKLLNIKKGSLVESIGLENGDIVKEINGKSINKPEEAFLAYQQLKDGGGFTIEIERKGKAETIYYEVR